MMATLQAIDRPAASGVEARDVLEVICDLVRTELHAPDLRLNAASGTFNVPGWRSAATVAIILAVEARYNFEMSSAQMERVRTIGDLVALVESRG